MPYADPVKQREAKAEWARENYQRKTEEDTATVGTALKQIRQLMTKKELEKIAADKNYTPNSPEKPSRPLPDKFLYLLETLPPNLKDYVHAGLSQIYYAHTHAELIEESKRAEVEVNKYLHAELKKNLRKRKTRLIVFYGLKENYSIERCKVKKLQNTSIGYFVPHIFLRNCRNNVFPGMNPRKYAEMPS